VQVCVPTSDSEIEVTDIFGWPATEVSNVKKVLHVELTVKVLEPHTLLPFAGPVHVRGALNV
jgi:hypothetical protein